MPLCALVPKMSRYMKNLIVLGAFALIKDENGLVKYKEIWSNIKTVMKKIR